MTIQELIETMKLMGLCSSERNAVCETYRDCGHKDALEQARSIATRNKNEIRAASAVMEYILGA